MSNDKDREKKPAEPPGKEEEVKSPEDRKEGSGEIRLREIPGLAELESRRKQAKRPSITLFTLILVILFGFTVVIFLLNKYREEHILAAAAEEEEAAVVTRETSGTAEPGMARSTPGKVAPKTTAEPQTPQTQVGPAKYGLPETELSGKALLKVRAKGPLISNEKDPEIAAVGEALRVRVEMLYGVRRRAQRGSIIETAAGVFQGFKVNSTRVTSAGKVTKDEIVVTTPTKGIFIIRNNILDAWRNCNYEQIYRDLDNSGIKVIKRADPVEGIVNVRLSVTALKGIPAVNGFLISRRRVGRIELDMTIRQMKSALPGNYVYVKKRIEFENEYYDVIKVFDGKKTPLFFVNEKDNRVWGIQLISAKYKTGKGIGIGSTLGSLKIYYPKPRIWSTKGSAPLVSVDGIAGVFILQNEGIDFEKRVFPNSAKIESILIGGSPYLK